VWGVLGLFIESTICNAPMLVGSRASYRDRWGGWICSQSKRPEKKGPRISVVPVRPW
jgi:hypothetical protein